MAGPAFHISSRKTTSAVGRYPFTACSYLSDSFKRLMLTGPNISSGVEKRDIRYSNALASTKALFNRRATIDFATPGGPSNKILSPAKAASKDKPISASFSYTPLFISDSSNCIRSFISILFFDSAHKKDVIHLACYTLFINKRLANIRFYRLLI